MSVSAFAPASASSPALCPRLVLASGAGNLLLPKEMAPGGALSGEFMFRGHRLRITVEDPAQVLYPTDCGMSLIAALNLDPLPLVGQALDVGSGSGVYATALLAAGVTYVTALDLDAACAAVARVNVGNNRVSPERLSTLTADLAVFQAPRRYDLVVANPPHLPTDPTYSGGGGLAAALVGGPHGRDLYDTIIDRTPDLLTKQGTLLLAHSSLADIPLTCQRMTTAGFAARTLLVCELDIPLLAYAQHETVVLARLEQLRDAGRAAFAGRRFEVHVLAFTRETTGVTHDRVA